MLLRTIQKPFQIIHRNVSALYLTGDKAKETFSVLVPYFDFNSKLGNRNTLQENIDQRKLNYNLSSLYEKWELYRDIEIKKSTLEIKRIEIANELRNIKDNNTILMEKLKTDGRIVRDDLKNLKENSYSLEDNFIHQYLKLPNELDANTPYNGVEKIVLEHLEKIETNAVFHLENEQIIEWYNETCFYFRNYAARFNLKLPILCVEYFIHYDKFLNFSNPDFIRSIISEAAGLDGDELISIAEDLPENSDKLNYLQIVGGGSTLSFLGFIAKLSIFPSALPIKWITDGNQYLPCKDKSLGLYSACQSTTVNAFIATENASQSNEEFEKTLENLIKLYKQFDLHFKVSYLSADKLSIAESARASLQMWSPHFKKYIEVGNLSKYNDFISKRLLFNVRDGRDIKFPHIISGTLVNVPKLVAVILESNDNNFVYPKFLY